MKIEKDKSFYNQLYQSGGFKGEYLKSPKSSIYYPIWNAILKNLTERDIILELGCGAGQLAQLIINSGFNYRLGIDISMVAISLAQIRNQNDTERFQVGNIYDDCWYSVPGINTIIMTEVLEHLNNDLKIVSMIPKDCKVLLSLPNFDSSSHVRFFRNAEDVINRYFDWLKLEWIDSFCINSKVKRFIWVFKGYRI